MSISKRVRHYVMRHGPAEDAASSGRDGDRALTMNGRQRVRAVAHLLRSEGEVPWRILTSPYVRALQTAEIVAACAEVESQGGTLQVDCGLQSGRDVVLRARALFEQATETTMIVGHEPDMSDVVAELAGIGFSGFEKAMVVCLESRENEGRLVAGKARVVFVLDPKGLRLNRTP